ncbi:MAG: metal ABC transporter ATP-binding protein [Candidatus Limnocylindria bacterium]
MAEAQALQQSVPSRVDRHATTVRPGAPIVVSLRDVAAGYGEMLALEHVTLDVPAGSLVAVVGPNGAGKSTLLKVIAGLLAPWRGEVSVLGGAPGQYGRRIAYVPQAELVDWAFPVSVAQVVMMGRYPLLGPLRRPTRDDQAAVDRALSTVRMADLRDRQIGALSGGQRRRAFLARALAGAPDLFLLDEPVTGIDATTQEEIMDVLGEEAVAGRTVIATTHDLACAAECFGRVVAVNRTVVADGPSEIALDANVLARAYGGHLLLLAGDRVMIDDAHHHDEEAPGEHHYHDRNR